MRKWSLKYVAPLAAGIVALSAGCSSNSPNNPTDGPGNDGGTGSPCAVADDIISDFTMDNGVKPVDGRTGGWFTYADRSGLGTLTPGEGMGAMPDLTQGNSACSGNGSLHVKAVNFTDWGAATAVDFTAKVTGDAGSQVKGTYNASKYRGISFWAKAATAVRFAMVKFLDPYTEIPSVLPSAEWCEYRPMMPTNCSPYIVKFGFGYTGDNATANMADYPKYVDYKIDVTWKRFEILFADAKQDRYNPGKKSPGDKLDITQLVGMAIQVNSDRTTNADMSPVANDFEIWVDDVAFIK